MFPPLGWFEHHLVRPNIRVSFLGTPKFCGVSLSCLNRTYQLLKGLVKAKVILMFVVFFEKRFPNED